MARGSTGMKLETVHVDNELVGFLECAAERTKTSVSLERKVRFLPIAVPVQSLTSPPWLPVWNQLRLDQGLTASGYNSHAYPVMPCSSCWWRLVSVRFGRYARWRVAEEPGCGTPRLWATFDWPLIAARLLCCLGARRRVSITILAVFWDIILLLQTSLSLSIQETLWPNL